MQKQWNKPELQTLDLSMTLAGPTSDYIDATYSDQNETVHLHS
ncbi:MULTISPECIES: paeninodin family lasso peptide [Paenibacillus]|jgi:hypothetical protein|nr:MULTISPECIES: paeninodin family lasso peptide [Paenibacillus]KRE75528.1 recombinase RecA [Paenibacillus sp. Soil750]NQX60370.1 paeninodin family lasso peptide [Paenibacillus qinlingensis]